MHWPHFFSKRLLSCFVPSPTAHCAFAQWPPQQRRVCGSQSQPACPCSAHEVQGRVSWVAIWQHWFPAVLFGKSGFPRFCLANLVSRGFVWQIWFPAVSCEPFRPTPCPAVFKNHRIQIETRHDVQFWNTEQLEVYVQGWIFPRILKSTVQYHRKADREGFEVPNFDCPIVLPYPDS